LSWIQIHVAIGLLCSEGRSVWAIAEPCTWRNLRRSVSYMSAVAEVMSNSRATEDAVNPHLKGPVKVGMRLSKTSSVALLLDITSATALM
jgi:hypothetical protein